jgi:hypothetical protein
MSPHIRGVPARRDEPREILMLLRPFGHLLRWPVRIGVFVAHLMHHLAAFFAWIEDPRPRISCRRCCSR